MSSSQPVQLPSVPPVMVVPIFPLPDITLFPYTALPLHIFETRSRGMVPAGRAGDRRLCLVQLGPGYEASYEGRPAVAAVAGVGEIVSCERLATGRYNLLVSGLCRVRIEQELATDTLYRVVRARRLDDLLPAGDVGPLRRQIRQACGSLLDALERPRDVLETALSADHPPGVFADRVAAAFIPDSGLRQQLLETLTVESRLSRLAQALDALVRELRGGRE